MAMTDFYEITSQGMQTLKSPEWEQQKCFQRTKHPTPSQSECDEYIYAQD